MSADTDDTASADHSWRGASRIEEITQWIWVQSWRIRWVFTLPVAMFFLSKNNWIYNAVEVTVILRLSLHCGRYLLSGYLVTLGRICFFYLNATPRSQLQTFLNLLSFSRQASFLYRLKCLISTASASALSFPQKFGDVFLYDGCLVSFVRVYINIYTGRYSTCLQSAKKMQLDRY